MRNFIVFTTIYPPTEAVRLWSKVPGWRLIGVADRKTPADWSQEGCEFITCDAQRRDPLGSPAKMIPWDHYARKNIGYVAAAKAGAEVIVDTDDDNLPKPGWRIPDFDGVYDGTNGVDEFVNAYRFFSAGATNARGIPYFGPSGDVTAISVWPRGYPLDRAEGLQESGVREETVKVGVWQGLADGAPDVDAIFRMTRPQGPITFAERPPVVLAPGSVCPFNSQNTAFRKELFPLLYLPCTVTFRFTDILRGLVAQPLMWQAGYRLGFTSATVVQNRNPHDYMQDFESEIPCYLHASKVHRVVQKAIRKAGAPSLAEGLLSAYRALADEQIVERAELRCLESWLAAMGY